MLPCYGTFQNTHSPKLAPAEVCFSVARDRTARFHVNCAFEYCVFATKILSSPQAPTRRNRRKKVATRSRHYYCDKRGSKCFSCAVCSLVRQPLLGRHPLGRSGRSENSANDNSVFELCLTFLYCGFDIYTLEKGPRVVPENITSNFLRTDLHELRNLATRQHWPLCLLYN